MSPQRRGTKRSLIVTLLNRIANNKRQQDVDDDTCNYKQQQEAIMKGMVMFGNITYGDRRSLLYSRRVLLFASFS
jgi:hypothetical protein